MKYLILGSNGMLGHMVSLFLQERNHQVVGFSRTPSKYFKSITGDAKNLGSLTNHISTGAYDFIINCIGILNQNAEQDKADAVFLNSYLPHYLAKITQGTSTGVVHISTDCVFSGQRGSYTEKDHRDGESFYARSKALGELEDENNLTLRTSIIGPDLNPHGIGLLNWFMQQNGTVNGYKKSIWSGQTTLQLAKTIEEATRVHAHGLVNTVPEKPISKYDLLCLLNHFFRNDEICINAVDGPDLDKSLKTTDFSFAHVVPDYQQMVRELAQWVRGHCCQLYPHYYFGKEPLDA